MNIVSHGRLIGMAAIIGLGWAGASAQDKETAPAAKPAADLPRCPIMGEEINFGVSTMTNDGPVFFCCPSCIHEFEKNPAKHEEAVAKQREILSKRPRIQATCPVSEKAVDGKTFAEVEGKKVGFCCAGCVDKYKAEPAKYKGRLEASYTYQTACPVSGKEISPAASTELKTGERVYFCCAMCIEKFNKDIAAYAPKLAEQGLRLNLRKLSGK